MILAPTSSSPRARARAFSPLLALAAALDLACTGDIDPTSTTLATGTDGGTTNATDTTGAPAVCGDGEIGPGEACDGANLGEQTCQGLGAPYLGGALACDASCANVDATACQVDPAGAHVRINEVLARGAEEGEYAGRGDLIELVNAGAAAADLSGWRLTDDPLFLDEATYTFSQGTILAPGARLVLVEYNDAVDVGDFPFGVSSSKSETLLLADQGVVIVDAVTFDGALADPSSCRIPDGGDTWQTCVQTPGAANLGEAPITCGDGSRGDGEQCEGSDLGGATCASIGHFKDGTLACTAACTLDITDCAPDIDLVINELSSSDADLIELYNAGPAPIDLSGWILTDDPTDPYDPLADLEAMVFADGQSLAAGAFLVIEKGTGPGQHPFGLGGAGDSLRLFDADLELVDAVTYGDQDAALALCRLPDGPGGAWTPGCVATFGGVNQGP